MTKLYRRLRTTAGATLVASAALGSTGLVPVPANAAPLSGAAPVDAGAGLVAQSSYVVTAVPLGLPSPPTLSNADLAMQARLAAQAELAEQRRKAAQREAARLARERREARQRARERAAREAERRALTATAIPTSAYTLTATFGMAGLWSNGHTGLDFAAPAGTPVVAARAGEVTFAGWEGAYGQKIEVTHADGTVTWYAHLSTIVVAGGPVAAGQQIGTVGSTGNSTGNHLHFEVRPGDGDPIDPYGWLVANGVQP
jgi:murein DD-endopeptidase MepM/ murein hydrolase activator NlpD